MYVICAWTICFNTSEYANININISHVHVKFSWRYLLYAETHNLHLRLKVAVWWKWIQTTSETYMGEATWLITWEDFSIYYFNAVNKHNILLYCTKIKSPFWFFQFMNPNDTQVNQTQHVTHVSLYTLVQVQMTFFLMNKWDIISKTPQHFHFSKLSATIKIIYRSDLTSGTLGARPQLKQRIFWITNG
jgi:hypothetical protein